MNKRGQGLSISTIILIILGLIVLVILVLGFILGWDKIVPWVNSDNNVDTIMQACQTACTTGSKYSYCSMQRELKAPGLPEGVKSKIETCNFFATDPDYESYGIETCPGITC